MACLAIVALLPYREFLSDDGYIYLRFVRNFTATGALVYNDVPTYGMTSPLWVVIVSLVNLPLRDPLIAVKIVAFLLSAASLFLYDCLVRRVLRGSLLRTLTCIGLMLDPWFAKWMVSGLENPLTLSLFLLFLLGYLRQRNSGRANLLPYVTLGLLPLCRPELFLLLPLTLIDILAFERLQRSRHVALLVGCSLLIQGAWMGVAAVHFGTLIPNTVAAKRVEAGFYGTTWGTLVRCGLLLGGSGSLHFVMLAFWAVLFWRTRRARSALRALGERWFLLGSACLGLPLLYVLAQASVSGRYLVPSIALVNLFGFLALERVLATLRLRRFRLLALVYAGCLFASLAVLQWRFTFFVTRWPRGMDPGLVEIALWLRENSPADAVVAATQIGVLGYFSERAVLDTAGLCSPEVIPFMRNASVDEFVLQAQPDYLMMDQEIQSPELAAASEPVLERSVQREGTASLGRPMTYTLYRLHFVTTK